MVLVIFMWYTRKKEVIKMEGKFNIWQKCLEIVCFVLILASSIYKESSPNLCVNSSFSYVVLSTLLLSSRDLTEWSLVYHSTLSYQRFYDLHSIHYDHLEGLHQLIY